MEKILTETIRCLEKGELVVWATIVDQQGSAPRAAGSRMLISQSGKTLGSVGGGHLEAETMETAHRLQNRPGQKIIEFSLTGEEVAETEMICGCRASVCIETLDSGDLPLVKSLLNELLKGNEVRMLTLTDSDSRSFKERHLIFGKSGALSGELVLSPEMGEMVEKTTRDGHVPVLVGLKDWDGFLFLEALRRSSCLYLFGGGHISLDLAWMAHRVGFQVIVVDDREGFANRERFPMAFDVQVSPFPEVCQGMRLGRGDFVVIVTRGHLYDLDVLRQMIVQSPEYIGMIGSRRKKEMIFEQLLREGLDPAWLDRVHAPIGLAIQAETPAEIAVSILAEMIQVRALGRKSNVRT